MKNLKTYFVLLSILFLKTGDSQSNFKIDNRTKFVIDSTYNKLIKKHKVIGASIAIVDNNEIVYATGYGFSDREKLLKADEKTVYRIGCINKSFTALSIMQLQDKKIIDINNSIKKYLPELKIESRFNDNNQIYIKDILSHTSGLPSDVLNGFFCDSPPKITWLIEELNKQTTICPRQFLKAYSNVGYGLLGEMIARVSNLSYSNYVKENIFKQLQMTSSYIENDEQLNTNFSKAYLKNKVIKEPLIRDQAAGLIHSNVMDMSNYLKMYLNNGSFNSNKIISNEALIEMEKNQLDSVLLSGGANWGYGLYSQKALIKKDNDSMIVTIIGHGGDTYAFHADFAFIKELNIGVVILTNTDNGVEMNDANKLLKQYIELTKVKKVTLNYTKTDTLKNQLINKIEENCSESEIKGKYNFGNFLMNVDNTKNIKFKQGSATIKLSQSKLNTNAYNLKAYLFHIVPIKIKGQEIQFVKFNNTIYIKQVNQKSKKAIYAANKSAVIPIPNNWKSHFGNYKIVNNYFACLNCPYGNAEGMKLALIEKDGFIFIKTKGKTPDTNNDLYLNMLSENTAVTGGIGRGTGETVRILENGNIYYSGFEFSKTK